ncbi:Metacaspase-1 OS=Schizosaccharomyces pombe (strain 972 / ATCC 24843) GN=pca1 PE=2 SV=1 [Rhizoctonia solani AG-1 IB]|uniref:Metacaspase-1 n=1 Tax=Thanatephorus cucumeris (strain AG1-IB / isolate 7/3/14) TaxID=1108050 RepID=A0A0B7FD44_THACB|nr:Metacaspase-1 OS=Schizosaccharomyces pombe (strain 972 / ATCC 24843) GN=pca1 PE=2 SV=1 [Rhizoctonia solani AG-1 IB]
MSTSEETDNGRARGPPEQTTSQGETESLPPAFKELRAEFEQNFTSKTWRGVQGLSNHSSNRRALVIGVGYGNRRPPGGLDGASVDALRVIKMLETFGYKPTDICVLTDITIPTSSFGMDLDEDDDAESRLPKRINIIKGLRWLANNTGPGEYRFLYFSGHGHYQPYNPFPASNQCIMPKDVEFQQFRGCSNCVCRDNVWRASDQKEEPVLVPEPNSVLWDHNINRLLANGLKAGTTMTAVFDCCYSGGVLETAFQTGPGSEGTEPNSKGRPFSAVVCAPKSVDLTVGQERNGPAYTPPRTEVIGTQLAEQDDILNQAPSDGGAGNYLGLPFGVDIVTRTSYRALQNQNNNSIRLQHGKVQKPMHSVMQWIKPEPVKEMARNQSSAIPIGTLQSTPEFTCERPGIVSAVSPLEYGCKVICWAACRKSESAFENRVRAGWFTEAFTEYLVRPKNREGQHSKSVQDLIVHLSVKFNAHNETLRSKKRGEQHPQLFVAKSLISGLGIHPHLKLDI